MTKSQIHIKVYANKNKNDYNSFDFSLNLFLNYVKVILLKKIKMSKKVEENKEAKENNLLNAAFTLFTEKGVKHTSIQEIVDKAGVAKGTFYLYFKDKYDVQEYLIAKKSKQLFYEAIESLEKLAITDYKEKIIYIIDYIIDEFIRNKLLLKFIAKNLSWGLYNNKISSIIDDSSLGLVSLFTEDIKKNKVNIKNPEVTLFMIIELTSSTVFSSITSNKPLPIDNFTPYLYNEIRKMLSE